MEVRVRWNIKANDFCIQALTEDGLGKTHLTPAEVVEISTALKSYNLTKKPKAVFTIGLSPTSLYAIPDKRAGIMDFDEALRLAQRDTVRDYRKRVIMMNRFDESGGYWEGLQEVCKIQGDGEISWTIGSVKSP